MPRARWTEERIKKLCADGRGQGNGSLYKPWIDISRGEFVSHGQSTLTMGTRHKRVHSLLSNTEYKVWLLLEWSGLVVDVREQFPLFPRADAWDLAESLGITHPVDRGTGTALVLTLDFLVRFAGPKRILIGLSAKREEDLADAKSRLWELLELERRAVEGLGIPWYLVLDTDLPKTLIANLEFLVDCAVLSKQRQSYLPIAKERAQQLGAQRGTLQAIASKLTSGTGASDEAALAVLCHLLWTRGLTTDLEQPIGPSVTATLAPEPNASKLAVGDCKP